jgi:hypothetical protein
VTEICNPSHAGSRDQEDCGSKSDRAKSSVRPYLEKKLHSKGLMEWLKVEWGEQKALPFTNCVPGGWGLVSHMAWDNFLILVSAGNSCSQSPSPVISTALTTEETLANCHKLQCFQPSIHTTS